MPLSTKSTLILGLLCAAAVLSACAPKKIPGATVSDLMEDRVKLDGVMMKCTQNPNMAKDDMECLNARVAVERLARQKDPVDAAKRAEDFERSREKLRTQQDRQREEQEAKGKVDAYHLPVIPVEPTPAPKDPQSPTVSQTN